MTGLLRLPGSPRQRLLLAACVAAAVLTLLSTAQAGLAPAAARAALAVAALAAAPALLRRRARPAGAASPLRVVAREPLGRDAGVALVEVDGRRLLVGFGPHGVRALALRPDGEVRS
jgi:flagellar protein FliO/FliZ